MLQTLIIFTVTCIAMISAVLFFPTLKIGKIRIDTYWIVALTGALTLVATKQISIGQIAASLTANTAVNPIKILILFICMTILSIFLDELGFFRYLADITLTRAGQSQLKLFTYLYLIVSVLTVFTSNDIIILSFTPFICYFAKNAKINPIPFLAAEFVAANTWSMALVIGNPTNIYLATAYGIGFFDYMRIMLFPTVVAGASAFFALYLLFRKNLTAPIEARDIKIEKINDKISLYIGVAHLSVCTAALAIGPYLGLEMWLISFVSVLSLSLFTTVLSTTRHTRPKEMLHCIERAPWQLVPFVLSMFIMVIALSKVGFCNTVSNLLGDSLGVFKYGVSSFLTANIINNIPMSVLYSSILEQASIEFSRADMFATVIGSNLGAFLTPIGALAGIMWSGMLKGQGVKFGYSDFLKIGALIAVPTLAITLMTLNFVI